VGFERVFDVFFKKVASFSLQTKSYKFKKLQNSNKSIKEKTYSSPIKKQLYLHFKYSKLENPLNAS
jgi:hypothetical protein